MCRLLRIRVLLQMTYLYILARNKLEFRCDLLLFILLLGNIYNCELKRKFYIFLLILIIQNINILADIPISDDQSKAKLLRTILINNRNLIHKIYIVN